MPEPLHLKDHSLEGRIFAYRLVVAAALVMGLSLLLVARFYNLQVTNHQDYATQSDRNRVHVQSIPPIRGLIYDRNGVLLADNRPSYTLSIVKERVADLDTTLALLQSLVEVSPGERENFAKRLKQRRRPFEAVPLRYRLNEEEIARIAVNEYRLEGVEVEAQLVRHYPLGSLLAHSVGYVGRISDRELSAFDEDQYRRYSGTHIIGKIGLEKQYESVLLGEVGYQNVETNARGRVLRVLEQTSPRPGKNLNLHLDIELQRAGFAALGDNRGALVAIDVASGGILAMVSTPSYDPNLFVTGISYKDYRELNESLDLPLFDRALQGQYPPGSTLKPVLGLGGLQHKVIDTEFGINDPGFYQLEGEERLYRDWTWRKKRDGHGSHVDLHMAIQQSCDTFYYDLAFRMGIDLMHQVGSEFGLGQRTGVDIPSERAGLWPSRQWKRGARGLHWFPGDSLNVGLGQGDVLTTPLQLASMTATLAARGERRAPRLVKAVDGIDVVPGAVKGAVADSPHWDYVFNAMKDVVHSARGTAQGIGRGAKYLMAGKTGTAQVVGIKQGEDYDEDAVAERQRDHALFVGFAPYEAPAIAVAVILENAGSGSAAAAPIARNMFDAFMAQENRELAGVREGED
ncbi:penicillin-binding protein 2 [Exilibacterium tricleocarpae]|uniref:Peptidoglycan D,D-transpeptidase MrdA n=1 Tax=Exilibacterium tricleocarpae TaxID=2591008 RepID=A0A545STH7_9GAMM|nr:penicillin-binding protein 2 [Exilibacterium tricleocarpae]TQV68261.1 penicillin-binding protein 2 [Exilibacterium tricleocarpae]